MAKQDGEAQGAPRAIQSQGEDAAKAYAVGEVAPRPLHPTVEMERVHIADPRRVPPPRGDERRGSGARNPEQRAPLADVGAPSVTMPEGLPVTKRQPIVIDSELLAQWHGERGGRGEGGAAEGLETAGAAATGAAKAAAGAAMAGAATDAAAGAAMAGAATDAAATDAAATDEAATDAAGAGAVGWVPRLAEVAAARRVERRAGRRRAMWVVAAGVVVGIASAALRTATVGSDGEDEVSGAAGGPARGGDVAPVAPAAPSAAVRAPAAPSGTAVAGAAAPLEADAGAPPDMETAMRAASARARSAAPHEGEVSARAASRPEGPRRAVIPSQESRPRGQAAPQRATPRPSATASAAPARAAAATPAREAPARPPVTAPSREAESASLPPGPYDKPNFD
ncbi:uncharacterized protein SOCEGT47_065920 [Sorangium cellulosum]|uniref:Uncharacterized protein n=1 Tax=Sorangium cellulosum TaxID=56 RepID=A0A4P2Q944_SORCE|nr:hypothetical protein [Sorangium cellulosum]AUX26039.1 uncharacterized protein SOCEGT47_065920 [Sorangium cellulosum]